MEPTMRAVLALSVIGFSVLSVGLVRASSRPIGTTASTRSRGPGTFVLADQNDRWTAKATASWEESR